MKGIVRLALVFAAVCMLPAASWADLSFCNRAPAKAEVTIAYGEKDAPGTTTNGHRGVTVEGWWSLAPGECAKVSGIEAKNYWVYFFAKSGPRVWEGTSFLCVPARAHRIGGHFMDRNGGCSANERLRGFRRIDASTRNYTMNLNN